MTCCLSWGFIYSPKLPDLHPVEPALSLGLPQEFNIEKLQLLESEKAKIRKDFERREGQVDVKKKMCTTLLLCFGAAVAEVKELLSWSQRVLQAAQRVAHKGAASARGRFAGHPEGR